MERFATNFRTHFLCFCHTFCIPIYFTNYDNNFSTSFYSFHCSSFLMFIKRNCVIETFAHFSIKICIRFSSIIFLIFHFFEFGCLFFFFCFCIIFVRFCYCLHASYMFTKIAVLLLFTFIIILTNMLILNDLWLLFSASFLFLKV